MPLSSPVLPASSRHSSTLGYVLQYLFVYLYIYNIYTWFFTSLCMAGLRIPSNSDNRRRHPASTLFHAHEHSLSFTLASIARVLAFDPFPRPSHRVSHSSYKCKSVTIMLWTMYNNVIKRTRGATRGSVASSAS